jgi:uncharacterized protein
MNQCLKKSFMVCVCLFVLTGQVIAESIKDDAVEAFMAGDYEKATKLYRPRAIRGEVDAQRYLGFIYSEGKGVPQDYKEAIKWYRLAAEQGDPDAQMRLGLMYADGTGVSQDYVLAHMWVNISATNEKDGSDAAKVRNDLANQMTSSQIAKAQELAKKCIAKKFKGC